MREIKFRAWGIEEQRMFEFEYWCGLRGFVKNDSDMYEIMQYTGLKDKNGVDIYEGDIVKVHWIGMGVVICKVCYFRCGYALIPKMTGYLYLQHLVEHPRYIEVIGNIYENTEQLESS